MSDNKIIENKADKRSTIIYRCRFAKAKGLATPMESVISPTATVEYSEEKNLLVINDLSSKTEELKEAIKNGEMAKIYSELFDEK